MKLIWILKLYILNKDKRSLNVLNMNYTHRIWEFLNQNSTVLVENY